MDFYQWVMTVRIQRRHARYIYGMAALTLAGYAVALYVSPDVSVMRYITTKTGVTGSAYALLYAICATGVILLRPRPVQMLPWLIPHGFYTLAAFLWWVTHAPESTLIGFVLHVALLAYMIGSVVLLAGVDDDA